MHLQAVWKETSIERQTLWLLVAGVLLVGSGIGTERRACAQDQQTITFEEAIDIALQQNTDLKRAQTDVRLRNAQLTSERMDFLPDLQVSSSGTRSFGRSFSQEEGEILSETSNFFGAEANTSVNLFNGFEKFSSLRRAGLEEEASTLRLDRTRRDVVFRVMEDFIALLQDQALVEVRRQELEAQQQLLEQVRSLVEVGRQPKSDLYQQQAARAEARAALAEAERQAELDKTRLMQVLQLNPRDTYTFETSSAPDSLPGGRAYDLDQLLETAFAQRTDLRALETSVAATQEGVEVARSGYWPSLSLNFGYGSDWSSTARVPVPGTGAPPRTITVAPEEGGAPATFPVPGTGSDPDFRRPSFFDQLDSRRGGSIRLSMSLPVFDRFQTQANVEAAQAQLQNAQYDFQDRRQQVALQVRQALLDYRSAQTRLQATTERLQAARRGREAARRRYELGAATFVELTQAVSEYVSAQNAQIQDRYDVVLAQKRIAYHTGRLGTRTSLFGDS